MNAAIIESVNTKKEAYEHEGTRVIILRELLRRLDTAEEQPSWRELADLAGVSSVAIGKHCKKLRRDGYVTWLPRRWRSLRLTPAGEAAIRAKKKV